MPADRDPAKALLEACDLAESGTVLKVVAEEIVRPVGVPKKSLARALRIVVEALEFERTKAWDVTHLVLSIERQRERLDEALARAAEEIGK